ncbi:Sec-independent protein translocase protein TatCy [archaeon HR01]|nr:Sec-independent protein translocase protein TatCy [archaeon HR01]
MSRDKEMPLLDHIRELKDRVKVIIISFVVATIFWLAFPADPSSIIQNPEFYKPMISLILERISADIGGGRLDIIGCSLTSPLEIIFLGAVFLAFITISPVLAYEIYAYVDPALYPHERRLIYGFVGAFTGLFAAGSVFGYLVAAPLVMRAMLFFFELASITPTVCAMDFYSLIFTTVLLIGVVFTSPAILVLLIRFGIVSTKMFSRNRLYIYGGLYILVAFITPDGWLVGNAILFAPLVILIEGALLVGRHYERQRMRAAASANPGERCKYCGAELDPSSPFCPSCSKSNV